MEIEEKFEAACCCSLGLDAESRLDEPLFSAALLELKKTEKRRRMNAKREEKESYRGRS